MSYRSVKVVKGNGGWGNDMVLTPTDEKKVVMSVTGAASTRSRHASPS